MVIKYRRMRLVKFLARMGEVKNAYSMYVVKVEEKRTGIKT
jgi:hypothetical protein